MPLSNATELTEKAENAFDKSDFSTAKICYQEAALAEALDTAHLTNMRVAHNHEWVRFARRISEIHPDEFDVRYSEICNLRLAGLSQNAIALCSELLTKFRDDVRKETSLRIQRYTCAVESQRYFDTLEEDFLCLWTRYDESHNAGILRKMLVKHVSRLSSPDSVPILEKLAKSDKLQSAGLRKLIQMKMDELEFIRTSMENITSEKE